MDVNGDVYSIAQDDSTKTSTIVRISHQDKSLTIAGSIRNERISN